MPKLKTKPKRSSKKRFKVTGTGKLMRRKSGTGHNTGKKSNSHMRRLMSEVEVNSATSHKIERTLGLR